MSKNTPLLVVASAMMALPFLTLSSCDSGAPDNSGESDFDLGTRFDEEALIANSGATVVMPQFLLQGDVFTHNVSISDSLRAEYGSGFQASDPPIIVDGAGQISTAEGGSTTENVSYIYEPDNGSFNLSEQNSFQANLGDEAIRDNFENRLEAIENVPFAQVGSLADAVAGNFTGAEASRIYEVAIESTGLIASDAGPRSRVTLAGETVTDTSVRIERRISYVPTSTNGELLASGVISGNVIITDTYVDVRVLLPHDNRGRVVALEPTTVIRVDGEPVEYDGIVSSVESHVGTFTLNLNSNAF